LIDDCICAQPLAGKYLMNNFSVKARRKLFTTKSTKNTKA